ETHPQRPARACVEQAALGGEPPRAIGGRSQHGEVPGESYPAPPTALKKPTRDSVSGRNRKRAWGVRWITRTPCRGRPAGAAKLRSLGNRVGARRGRAASTHAFTLRKVCRAGFAGRGTPSALSHRAARSLSVPDP